MRLQFVLSEIAIGLRRNLTMTISVVLVTLVSLFLFGLGILSQKQVSTMKDYWYDRVQVSIFLCGNESDTPSCVSGEVTQAQKDQILTDLSRPSSRRTSSGSSSSRSRRRSPGSSSSSRTACCPTT